MAKQKAKHLVFLWLMCFLPPSFISWKWYHTNQNHRAFRVQSVIERAPLTNWQLPPTPNNLHPWHHECAHNCCCAGYFCSCCWWFSSCPSLMGTGCGRQAVCTIPWEHTTTHEDSYQFMYLSISCWGCLDGVSLWWQCIGRCKILVMCSQKGVRCLTHTLRHTFAL